MTPHSLFNETTSIMEEKSLPPNVGAIVEYDAGKPESIPELHRVCAWLKPRPPRLQITDMDMALCGTMLRTMNADQAFDAFLYNVLLPNEAKGTALVWCLREEATHLSLYSAGPVIAPVEKCRVVGEVDWSSDRLAKAVESALRLAGKPSGTFL